MDVSGGGDFGGDAGSEGSIGAADESASPPVETENDLGADDAESDDPESPPPASTKPKVEAKPKPAAKPAAKLADKPSSEFVDVPGFGRVHKDDAPKAREFVKGAYGAFQQAAEVRKQLNALKAGDDPEKAIAALKSFGVDVDKIAHRRLSAKMQEQLQTPEEKAAAEHTTELQKVRAELEAERKKNTDREHNELKKHEIKSLEDGFLAALKQTGLPPRRATLQRMANVYRGYLAKGIDVPLAHVASVVAQERKAESDEYHRENFESSSDEEFDAYMSALPEKGRERVRAWLLKQIESPTQPPARPRTPGAAPTPKPAADKRMSVAEFHRFLES